MNGKNELELLQHHNSQKHTSYQIFEIITSIREFIR